MDSDHELDALIVENIGDIEAAAARATGYLDQRLWVEIAREVEAVCGELGMMGEFDPTGESVVIRPVGWPETLPETWFHVDEIEGSGGYGTSWIGEATGDNPSGAQMGFVLAHGRKIRSKHAARVMRDNAAAVRDLADAGFSIVGTDVYLPALCAKAELVEAFRSEDFSVALSPFREAVTCIAQHSATLFGLASAILDDER